MSEYCIYVCLIHCSSPSPLFIRWWAHLFSETDLDLWENSWNLILTFGWRQYLQITLLCPAPLLSPPLHPWRRKFWGIGHLTTRHLRARLPPPLPHHLILTSLRGSEQQPPWCCHRDKEMNCECPDVNVWECSLLKHTNKNGHVNWQDLRRGRGALSINEPFFFLFFFVNFVFSSPDTKRCLTRTYCRKCKEMWALWCFTC